MFCKFSKIGENVYKCGKCGFIIKSEHGPEKIHKMCGIHQQPEFPSILQQIVNVGAAVVDYAKSGFRNASPEEQNRRLSICKGCEFYSEGLCAKCGCNLAAKSVMEVSKCPINKW